MRVYLKKNITAYSGKDGEEDVVYSAHNQGNVCIAKNFTKPKEISQHLTFKANADTIRGIWAQATPAYKTDLRTYCSLFNDNFPDKLKASCYSMFIKIVYAYAKSEGIEITTLDIASLRTSVIKNVKSTIENGLLPALEVSTSLDSVI
jgi:hypothetical protein